MSFLKSLLPIAGSVVGGIFGGPVGASIGGSLGGAVAGSGAQNKASNQQITDWNGYETGALGRSNALMSQTRQDFDPFYSTGTGGLSHLNALMSNPGMALADEPGYQFRLGQGVEAIDRSAASRGMLNSGGTAKALTRYGQGIASDEINNIFNRYNTLAGYGLDAARANATVGTSATNATNDALLRSTLGRSSAYQDKGQTNSALYGGIGGAAGQLAGGLFGNGGIFNKAAMQPPYNTGINGQNVFTDPNQLAGLF